MTEPRVARSYHRPERGPSALSIVVVGARRAGLVDFGEGCPVTAGSRRFRASPDDASSPNCV